MVAYVITRLQASLEVFCSSPGRAFAVSGRQAGMWAWREECGLSRSGPRWLGGSLRARNSTGESESVPGRARGGRASSWTPELSPSGSAAVRPRTRSLRPCRRNRRCRAGTRPGRSRRRGPPGTRGAPERRDARVHGGGHVHEVARIASADDVGVLDLGTGQRKLGEDPLVRRVPAGIQDREPDRPVVRVIDRSILAPGQVEAHRDHDVGLKLPQRPGQVAAQRHAVLDQPVRVAEEQHLRIRRRPLRCDALLPPAAARPSPGPGPRCRPRRWWRAHRRPACPARSSGRRQRRHRTPGHRGGRPRRPRAPSPRPLASWAHLPAHRRLRGPPRRACWLPFNPDASRPGVSCGVVLPRVQAIRYVTPLREGGSLPA